jgi:hypothetical protein
MCELDGACIVEPFLPPVFGALALAMCSDGRGPAKEILTALKGE